MAYTLLLFMKNVILATRYRLDAGDRIPRGGGDFSAPYQTGPEAHPSSYSMLPGLFPGGKAAGAWR
jgi:hypothetical protein